MFDLATLISSAARKHPDARFVLDTPLELDPHRGRGLSYTQMADVVDQTARYLHRRGVKAGDVVAVYKRQNPDILPLACAIARLGAVPAMLSSELGAEEASALLAKLGPNHLVSSEGIPVEHPSTILAGEIAERSLQGDVGVTALPPVPTPVAEDVYLITHTSGTTGLPKLVPQARRGTQMPITVQSVFARALGYREPFALAMSFVHGRTFAAFAAAIQLGISVLLVSDPSADKALPLLAEERPGGVETHPNMAMAWEAHLAADPTPLANVRAILSTFDAIHPRTVRRLLGSSSRRGAMLFQSYGQTETGPISNKTYTRGNVLAADSRSVGHTFPTLTSVRILDEQGRPVRRGQVGRIGVKSAGMGLDYLHENERFRSNFVDGWWLMGDYGSISRTGEVRMEDRGDDRLPGVVSALRVEDRITEAIQDVREVVLVGDAERQFLAYTPYEGTEVTAQRVMAASGLPASPSLTVQQLEWEQFPMTSTWKVRRSVLLRDLSSGLAAGGNAAPVG